MWPLTKPYSSHRRACASVLCGQVLNHYLCPTFANEQPPCGLPFTCVWISWFVTSGPSLLLHARLLMSRIIARCDLLQCCEQTVF